MIILLAATLLCPLSSNAILIGCKRSDGSISLPGADGTPDGKLTRWCWGGTAIDGKGTVRGWFKAGPDGYCEPGDAGHVPALPDRLREGAALKPL